MVARNITHVVADGVSLAVHRIGRGAPVVCLTALGHDARDFDGLAERIADRFEIICIEWPGHGESADDHQPVGAGRYGDLLVETLDQLAPGSPILIGNSIGGAAAIHYASRRPIRGLVLCNSGGLVAVTPLVQRFCRVLQRFFAAGERGARWFGPAFWAYYHLVLTQPAASRQRRRIIAGGRRHARLLRQGWESFGQANADISEIAAALQVPIWIAYADRDKIIPLSYCLPAIRRMRNATLSQFKAGHSAFLEQPDAFASGFLDFVSRLPDAAVRGTVSASATKGQTRVPVPAMLDIAGPRA